MQRLVFLMLAVVCVLMDVKAEAACGSDVPPVILGELICPTGPKSSKRLEVSLKCGTYSGVQQPFVEVTEQSLTDGKVDVSGGVGGVWGQQQAAQIEKNGGKSWLLYGSRVGKKGRLEIEAVPTGKQVSKLILKITPSEGPTCGPKDVVLDPALWSKKW